MCILSWRHRYSCHYHKMMTFSTKCNIYTQTHTLTECLVESLPVVSTVLLGATLVTKCSLATDYNHKENVEPDVHCSKWRRGNHEMMDRNASRISYRGCLPQECIQDFLQGAPIPGMDLGFPEGGANPRNASRISQRGRQPQHPSNRRRRKWWWRAWNLRTVPQRNLH